MVDSAIIKDDPVALWARYNRDELLKTALGILLLPGQHTGTVKDVLDKITDSEDNNLTSNPLMAPPDLTSHWWASILKVAATWMLIKNLPLTSTTRLRTFLNLWVKPWWVKLCWPHSNRLNPTMRNPR